MNSKVPENIEVEHLVRNIIDKPRIIIYYINWEEENDKKEDTDNNYISEKEFKLIKEKWIKKHKEKNKTSI